MVITRLQCKLETVIARGGVSLDEYTTSDLSKVMEEEDQVVKEYTLRKIAFNVSSGNNRRKLHQGLAVEFAGTHL